MSSDKLFRFGFHHQNGVASSRDDEFEFGIHHLIDLRVQLVFARDIADACSANRSHERNARERKRRRRGNHRHNIGFIFQIVTEDGHNDLRFIAVARHEKRPDRPVDQT